jgi:uncharacterized membrane protein
MYYKEFFLVFILLALIDLPYLYLNTPMFRQVVKQISGKGLTDRYYSAIMVYIALALGITFLVLPRIRAGNNRLADSILYGGIFGIASYATFDFTIHFMLEGWSLQVAIMDTLWGAVLCSAVSFLVSYLL